MIVYTKLANLLKERNMTWKYLQDSIGISSSVMAKLQKNRNLTVETLDKVCTYLKVQPGDIMEWVENEDQFEESKLKAEIEALQKRLAEIQQGK